MKPFSLKVYVNDHQWSYFVGKSVVKIRSPKFYDYVVSKEELGATTITPEIIKDYAIKKLIRLKETFLKLDLEEHKCQCCEKAIFTKINATLKMCPFCDSTEVVKLKAPCL